MNKPKESMLLPPEYGGIEVCWPFTAFGRKADEVIRSKGHNLIQREFNAFNVEMDYTDCIQTERTYRSHKLDLEIIMQKNVGLPQIFSDEPQKSALFDFNPEEFVVYEGVPLIHPSVLMDKFESNQWGSENLYVNGGDILEMNVSYSKDHCKNGVPFIVRMICKTHPKVMQYLTDLVREEPDGIHIVDSTKKAEEHCLNLNCTYQKTIDIMTNMVGVL
tara:strand:- start:395 stop:1048 length:654 start_codon:yes stop_codon:yes gene_type:complete